jgi:thioredoxin reductase (NADPH)
MGVPSRVMNPPVLLAVDDDADTLSSVEQELHERYGNHYRVVCLRSPDEARARLEEFAGSGQDVAVVLAAQELPGSTGSELLGDVRRFYPHARRALLIRWGDWGQKPAGEAIFDGVSHGRFDHYVLRPMGSPDELFHHSISAMLLDWAEDHRAAPDTVHIVGTSWSGRAYELRQALQQCAIPHNFTLADTPEGRALVDAAGDGVDLPIIVFPNGEVLVNPTNAQIAVAAGGPASMDTMEFDVIIVGAGPAGLSAAVYGASEGLSTLVVDRGGIGGQATSSSLIRNYLGFPRGISGRRLAREAYDQGWIFGARFAFMQAVTALERQGEQLLVSLADFGPVRTTAVLLATGARYRRLGVPSLEALTGAGVFYGGPTSEAPALAGCDAFVVGGANSAGQAALHLARHARLVTLVVRGASLRAGMSEYLVRQVEATDNIQVRLGTEVVGGGGDGRLEHLVLCDLASRTETTVEAQGLFLLIGATPYTDWLPPDIQRDPQGFVLTGVDLPPAVWPLDRPPFALETSMPGVFAVGDVRHGSVKRVASAVGEGSIAVQLVHRLFATEQRQPRGRGAPGPGAVPVAH